MSRPLIYQPNITITRFTTSVPYRRLASVSESFVNVRSLSERFCQQSTCSKKKFKIFNPLITPAIVERFFWPIASPTDDKNSVFFFHTHNAELVPARTSAKFNFIARSEQTTLFSHPHTRICTWRIFRLPNSLTTVLPPSVMPPAFPPFNILSANKCVPMKIHWNRLIKKKTKWKKPAIVGILFAPVYAN